MNEGQQGDELHGQQQADGALSTQQQQHGGAFTGASFSRAFNLAPRTPAAETATPSSGSLAGPASVSLPMQLDGTSTTATAGGMNTSSMATRFPTAATTTFSSASVAGTSASAGVSSALESYPLFHRAGTAAASSSPVASSSRTSVSPGAGAWSPSPSHHPYNHLGHHHHPHHGGYGHPYAHHPHGSSFFPRKQSMLGSELASETSPSTPQPVEQEDTSSFREAEDETRARRRASSTSPSPQSRKEQMIHRSQSAPRHASGRASPTSSAGPSLASHLEGGVRNVPRSSGEGARAVSEDGRGNMAMIDAMDDDVDMVPSGASSAGGLGDRSLMRSQSGGGVSLDGDYGYDDDARMGGSSNASVGGARAGSASAATNRSMSMAPGETDDDQSMRVDLADLADLISPHQQQHHGPGYSAQSLAPGGSSPSGRRARSRSTSTSISYSLRSEAAAAAAAAVSQFNTTPPPQWKRKVFGAMEEDEVEQEMSQDGGELGTPSLMADELPRPQHADFAARRRMSSSASAGLELVPQERSGDNASSSSSNTQSGAQGGVRVVRRPVQRRQNLLPKPKAHLRVMMQIRGEATLSDAEIQSEAVMHRMSRAGTMSPGGAKHTTSPSWPSPSDHAFHDGPGLASPAGGAAGGSGGPARPSSSHGRPGRIGGHPPLHNRFPESVGDEEEDFAPSSSPSSTEDAYINDDAVTAAGSDWGAQSANGYVTEEDDTAAAQIDRDSRRVASMWGIEGMRGSGAGVGSAFRRDERPSPSSERVQKLMDIEGLPSTPSSASAVGRKTNKRKLGDDRFEPYNALKRRAVSPASLLSSPVTSIAPGSGSITASGAGPGGLSLPISIPSPTLMAHQHVPLGLGGGGSGVPPFSRAGSPIASSLSSSAGQQRGTMGSYFPAAGNQSLGLVMSARAEREEQLAAARQGGNKPAEPFDGFGRMTLE